MKLLAAGGFKDLTRISSSSPSLWEGICAENKDEILPLLGDYLAELSAVKASLEASDRSAVASFFSEANRYRMGLADAGGNILLKQYQLFLDIDDRPGTLARVLTLLAEARINVRNLDLAHNREHREGVLRLEFEQAEDRDRAGEVLRSASFPLHGTSK